MALNPRTLAWLAKQRRALDAILDAQERALALYWLQAWENVVSELTEVIEAIAANDARVSLLVRRRQAEQALQVVSQGLNSALSAHAEQLSTDLQRVVDLAQQGTQTLITSQLPASMAAVFNRADPQQVAAILQRATEQITVRHYWLQAEATAAMKRELIRAIPLGVHPNETARRMVKAVRGEFNGGVHRARVIARTEQLDAHRAAAQATEQANKDVLAGWEWHAQLEARTCASCWAMHGTLHDIDEPGPLDHHQGRCTRLPVTKSWSELGFSNIPEPVFPQQSAAEAFDKLDPEIQQHILGKRGYEAWQQGQWPMNQWSERRSSDGWRDAHHKAKPPESSTR